MTTAVPTPAELGLERWHTVVRTRDTSLLPSLVAADAVFTSPAVFRPQEGRDLVVAYLTAALAVLGEGFRYERTWGTEASGVLEFVSAIDGKQVHGVDIIEWDADGLIRDFTVMVRPLSALHLLVERMGERLTAMAEGRS